MKKSIAYLPATNQADFRHIADAIMSRIKQTEMIILFGSYARNDFVVYNSGCFDLARRRKLNYSELKQQAEEYFDDKYERGCSFL